MSLSQIQSEVLAPPSLAARSRESFIKGLDCQENLAELAGVLSHFGCRKISMETIPGGPVQLTVFVKRSRISSDLQEEAGDLGYGSEIKLRGKALSQWLRNVSTFLGGLKDPQITVATAADIPDYVSVVGDLDDPLSPRNSRDSLIQNWIRGTTTFSGPILGPRSERAGGLPPPANPVLGQANQALVPEPVAREPQIPMAPPNLEGASETQNVPRVLPDNLEERIRNACFDFRNCPTILEGQNRRYDGEEYNIRLGVLNGLLVEANRAPLNYGTTPTQIGLV
jgi:hypothetical protein